MSFVLKATDRDILKQRLGLSAVFLRRLEAVLEQGDDSATDLSVDDLTATKSVVAGTTIAAGTTVTAGSALVATTTVSDANGDVKPFKRYIALLTQSSTSAPTATILVNELGVTPTLGRTSAGLYTITATGLFTTSKTAITIGAQLDLLNRAKAIHTSANVVTISTSVLSESSNVLIQTATDGLLTAALVEIKVFN